MKLNTKVRNLWIWR